MDRVIHFILDILIGFQKWDKTKTVAEFKVFSQLLVKQLYNQIPGVSAAAGLAAGGWIASTFTTSPIKAQLASWGLISGATHAVSGLTYRLMSILIPLLAAGATAYLVQKLLKIFRDGQMKRNMALVSRMGQDVRDALQEKLSILEKAREAGILSQGEYLTKKANLVQTYSRLLPEKLKELLMNKLTG
jgi:hypothetical protein